MLTDSSVMRVQSHRDQKQALPVCVTERPDKKTDSELLHCVSLLLFSMFVVFEQQMAANTAVASTTQ